MQHESEFKALVLELIAAKGNTDAALQSLKGTVDKAKATREQWDADAENDD